MKIIISVLAAIIPFVLNAQENRGVTFIRANSWQEILNKAREEKKNIFVDGYTTWCGPCKKMDSEVFTNEQLGAIINQNFIVIKIQFDKTKNDPIFIQEWYTEADRMLDDYKITTFPTYLFFSSEGTLIQKENGYKTIKDFISIVSNISNADQDYNTAVWQYRSGIINKNALLTLAKRARDRQDDSLAYQIATSFKKLVLDSARFPDALNMDVRNFIVDFQNLFTLQDSLVTYLYKNKTLSDLALGQKGFSTNFTDYLIAKELIYSVIKPNGVFTDNSPDWNAIKNRINQSYDLVTGDKLLTRAKIDWYDYRKDWSNVVKYNIEKISIEGIDSAGFAGSAINNMVYDVIFMHSDEPTALNKGIEFMEYLLDRHWDHDTWIDTYANLLYKSGRKKEALKYEELALSIAKKRKDQVRINEYQEIIKKIRNGQPTWIND
jgi:thioredoxin-related protein